MRALTEEAEYVSRNGSQRKPVEDGAKTAAALLLVSSILFSAVACGEDLPTSTDDDLFPVKARTVEVRLPFDAFGTGLRVDGGFGRTSDLPDGILALDFDGRFNARTLVRFPAFPRIANVRDTTGTTRPDSALTFVGGTVVVRLNPTRLVPAGPVELVGGAVEEAWDPRSATWTHAVDSVDDRRAWSEEGGGPFVPSDTATWDPAQGDSVLFRVDSSTVARWIDTTSAERGYRVETRTSGARMRVSSVSLNLDIRPSLDPDTIINLSIGAQRLTFLFDPPPGAPGGDIRIGGAPAWRTSVGISLPETLDGPQEVCDALGCPFRLTPETVIFASMVLTPRVGDPAYRPVDTLSVDARPVLSPERLPKSPLGDLVQLLTQRVSPAAFAADSTREVGIPMTRFVQDVIRGTTADGDPAPGTVALLSPLEPLTFEFLSFRGPTAPTGAPVLRLLVTAADGVGLP